MAEAEKKKGAGPIELVEEDPVPESKEAANAREESHNVGVRRRNKSIIKTLTCTRDLRKYVTEFFDEDCDYEGIYFRGHVDKGAGRYKLWNGKILHGGLPDMKEMMSSGKDGIWGSEHANFCLFRVNEIDDYGSDRMKYYWFYFWDDETLDFRVRTGLNIANIKLIGELWGNMGAENKLHKINSPVLKEDWRKTLDYDKLLREYVLKGVDLGSHPHKVEFNHEFHVQIDAEHLNVIIAEDDKKKADKGEEADGGAALKESS